MQVLALIPARAGSERVSNKNILLLCGKPLIVYTIEAAQKARQVTRVIVSTDSEKIADIARNAGAEVPFLRPQEIAQSNSTEIAFVVHALDHLKREENYVPDLVAILYPTSPFRTAQSIDKALEKMKTSPDADSLRSVRLCSEHPWKMWLGKGEFLAPFVDHADNNAHTWPYQQLPQVYIQNASIYITRPKTICMYGNTIGKKVLSFIMNDNESIDINNEIDFLFAGFMFDRLNSKCGLNGK